MAVAVLRRTASVVTVFLVVVTCGGTFTADDSYLTTTDSVGQLNQFINLSLIKDLEDHDRV